jgi:hypothetical protein
VCDHCGEQIESASQGNYQWRMRNDGSGTDGAVFFTHKHCCRAFEAANRGDVTWAWGELACFPVYLGNNLQLKWEKAKETARLFASIG